MSRRCLACTGVAAHGQACPACVIGTPWIQRVVRVPLAPRRPRDSRTARARVPHRGSWPAACSDTGVFGLSRPVLTRVPTRRLLAAGHGRALPRRGPQTPPRLPPPGSWRRGVCCEVPECCCCRDSCGGRDWGSGPRAVQPFPRLLPPPRRVAAPARPRDASSSE